MGREESTFCRGSGACSSHLRKQVHHAPSTVDPVGLDRRSVTSRARCHHTTRRARGAHARARVQLLLGKRVPESKRLITRPGHDRLTIG